jgi:hypothetical protein
MLDQESDETLVRAERRAMDAARCGFWVLVRGGYFSSQGIILASRKLRSCNGSMTAEGSSFRRRVFVVMPFGKKELPTEGRPSAALSTPRLSTGRNRASDRTAPAEA